MRKLSLVGILLVSISFLGSVRSVAQQSSLGDVQFELQAYELAIDSYLQELEYHPGNVHAMERLAVSYERTNDLINAARWYDKRFSMDVEKPDRLRIAYGKVLKSLGLLGQAREIFESCKESGSGTTAQHFARSCGFAERLLKDNSDFEIYLYAPSTSKSDFAPGFYQDQLVFASFDTDEKDPCIDPSLIYQPLNGIYVASGDRKTKSDEVIPFGSDLSLFQGISSLNFSSDGKKVLFTRNNFKNGNKQILGDEKDMSIYMAEVDAQGNFINEISLPFNDTDYSVAFACFGMDDQTIFFASNSHGQHQDFDIYSASFDGEDWGKPVNLGPVINTPGNEVTPFYQAGQLYFASDYHEGIGGYDNFRAEYGSGGWEMPLNMGKGINTMADDLYLIRNRGDGSYYYTSNRLGGKGNYDIYVSSGGEQMMKEDPMLAYENSTASIPKAVSLESLKENKSMDVRMGSATPVAYADNIMAPEDISLEGAILVSYGDVIRTPANVYFIQLASLSKPGGNLEQFKAVVEFGNVYRVKKTSTYKIRLGYFYGEQEAKSVLAQVRQKGFRDAFIVEDVLDIKELELLVSSFSFHNNEKYVKPDNESEFKVRLAAYSNPLYFDTEKVKDIGVIEQWSKGKWTIFILSGYSNMEEANKARIKAVNRGFTGAEIVRDDDGILTRVHLN